MKLFGTDGIRGRAGAPPLDPKTINRVGAALAHALPKNGTRTRVVIGRDTRESGEWIERELTRGLAAEGGSAVSAGVIPTPAIAYLTRNDGFDAGIVISASHNPFEDNGLKVFSGRGEKLAESLESEIERMVADSAWTVSPVAASPESSTDLARHYVDHLKQILDNAGPLRGSRIVVDVANGATCTVAPALFRDLGFDVVAVADEPNGRNINLNCGSTHLGNLQTRVQQENARLGVAFDGDGDRALFVDKNGNTVDGDAVMLIAADHLRSEGRLSGNTVVATVMSNIGLELALRERGIELLRAPVGDKYVMEEMQKRGAALGGEQSGHIIFADHLFTGDGIATALNVLRIMGATGQELHELASKLVTYPQVLVNVRVRERADYNAIPAIAETIKKVEERLDGQGRLLIRYSGTEPLLRIMLEGRDDAEIRHWANEIADVVRAHLA